ncbi:hypothetical protein ACIOEW_11960 [Streptomyces sp. NPDC087901]|uniref:hypothetical protein n=1 Tax=unclassified Streptomyces TaxID=2593676 RepID=UPI00342DEAC0
MRSTVRNRVAALFTATAILAGSAITLGAGSASAAPTVTLKVNGNWEDGKSRDIEAYVGGKYAGEGQWQANGDTLWATDQLADGYGIYAELQMDWVEPLRRVTTQGHASPYTVQQTGNLPEGAFFQLKVCVKNSSYSKCSGLYSVQA